MSIKKQEAVRALRESLDKEQLDYDAILSLASSLAKNDQDKVRFTVDAGLINRLGLELVSKQETAVAELVKNAYDADAKTVDLVFKNTSVPGGSLEILDNGVGMSRDQIIDGFMRLSTQEKVANPISEKYQRRRAGRKGIGRFSAQRLARKLIIQTRRAGAERGLQVVIDWDLFAPGTELISVANKIEEIEKPAEGTTLILENLRDSWGEPNIARSYRYVSTLQPPFPISKTGPDDNKDPGFKVAFYLDTGTELQPIANEDINILSNALAQISGRVDDNGQGYWSMDCPRFGIKIEDKAIGRDRENAIAKYRFIRKVRLTAGYFIMQSTLLPKLMYGQIKDVLDKSGGIRLYRNGFRVLPYGEPFDDWLRLERSSALREILPPHRNNNFLGYVELDDPAGKIFEETASREGLVENEAYDELRDFISRCLKFAATVIAEHRGKKVLAKDKAIKPRRRLEDVINELRRIVGPNKSALAALAALDANIVELDETQEELIDEMAMLRVLASLGLSIGEFTHEIRHNLSALVADAMSVKGKVPEKSPADKLIVRMQGNLAMLRSYARYFDEAVADNAHRELIPNEIRDVLNAFERIILPTAKRAGIELSVQVQGYDLFTRPMHRSEWASVLLNLFTNAVKAIKRAGSNGKISILAGEEDARVFVEFADNGDGIPEENRDRIFHAFFTTTSPSAPLATQNEELVGSGLGLKITKDIVESHEGEIMLISPPKDFSTCFRLEIPKATEAEMVDEKN